MMYAITDENIEKSVESLQRQLEANSANHTDVLRWSLLIEQLLLLYRERDGGSKFKLKCVRRKQRIRVCLTVKAEEHNYLQTAEDPILAKLVTDVSSAFVRDKWSGCNIITGTLAVPVPSIWNLRFLMPYLAKEKWRFVAALFFQICMIFTSVIIPVMTAKLINAFTDSEITRIIIVAILLMFCGVVSHFCDYFSSCQFLRAYHAMRNELEIDLSRRVFRLADACIQRYGTGTFVQRMVNDTDNLALGFNRITDILSYLVRAFGVILAVGCISVPLCLFFVFSAVLSSYIEIRRTRKKSQDDRVFRNEKDHYSGFVSEMVRGAKDIKLQNSKHIFVEKMSRAINETNRANRQMEQRSAGGFFVRLSAKELCDLVLYVIMAILILKGKLSSSSAIIVLTYNSSIASLGGYFGSFLNYFNTICISSERIFQIMFSPDFQEEKFGNLCPERFYGNISFQNVSFSYVPEDLKAQECFILDGLSFDITAGETIAIVGKSGSGKTTIFNLLTGLYRPNSGKIMLDGRDLSEYSENFIRGNISAVSQNSYIFNMSVRENLSLAGENISLEEMDRACRAACIFDDIMAMPDKYNTILGEGGVNLSGGQRQRLAIARCLLRKTRVILLDEATSALDNETQANVTREIGLLFSGCTVITVAHRLSTIVNSNRILFLSDGKILAEGSHETLLRECESYRNLYQRE